MTSLINQASRNSSSSTHTPKEKQGVWQVRARGKFSLFFEHAFCFLPFLSFQCTYTRTEQPQHVFCSLFAAPLILYVQEDAFVLRILLYTPYKAERCFRELLSEEGLSFRFCFCFCLVSHMQTRKRGGAKSPPPTALFYLNTRHRTQPAPPHPLFHRLRHSCYLARAPQGVRLLCAPAMMSGFG